MRMTIRYVAALALLLAVAQPAFGGWYLMAPPDRQGLDPLCHHEWHPILAWLAGRTDDAYNTIICDQEAEFGPVLPDEPLSKWHVDEKFETLAECEAELARPFSEDEQKRAESSAHFMYDDNRRRAPKETAALLGTEDQFVAGIVRVQHWSIEAEQCIASDDPRLKRN